MCVCGGGGGGGGGKVYTSAECLGRHILGWTPYTMTLCSKGAIFCCIGRHSSCPTSLDYVPSVFTFGKMTLVSSQQKMKRYESIMNRQSRIDRVDEALDPQPENCKCDSTNVEFDDDANSPNVVCVDQAVSTNNPDEVQTLKETLGDDLRNLMIVNLKKQLSNLIRFVSLRAL